MPRTSSGLLLPITLIFLAWGTAHAEPESIVDDDYRFRLEAPGPGWRLLPEAEITKLVPDAIAGAMKSPGLYGVVIAESAPEAEVEALARLVLDNMPLESREIHVFEKIRYLEREAVLFQVSGTVNGIRAVFRNVVFLRQGHAYQVLCWAPEISAAPQDLERFARAFALLPGEVRGRTGARRLEDQYGVGWRVKDGVFASAAYGLVVEPGGGWRLAIGAELDQMNPDAEIGLVHAAPEAYVAIIAERAAGSDREDFLQVVRESGVDEMGLVASGEPYSVTVAGHEVRMQRYRGGASTPLRFRRGAFFVGDVCIQIVAWHLAGLEEALEPVFPQALAAVRLLGAEERTRLAAELADAPDPNESVGQGYVLRGGRYCSFEYGFTWEAPPGWWRLTPGQAARQENPDATLLLEEPAIGLFGTLVAEGAQGLSADAYHRRVVSNFFGDDFDPPPDDVRTIPLGQATGRVTRGTLAMGAGPFDFHVLTTVYRGRALQLLVTGTAGNLRSRADGVERALRALRVHRELRPVSRRGETVEDWRLGYAMRPPGAGWKYQEVTPAAMRSLASLHSWSRDRTAICALGVCALQEGQDAAWFEGLIGRIIQQRSGVFGDVEPGRTKIELAGREAVRIEWRQPNRRVVVCFLGRGRSFYAVLLETPPTGAASSEREILAGFRLLD